MTPARAQLLDRVQAAAWGLARAEGARGVGPAIRHQTHALFNFIQIVDLAGRALAPHTAAPGAELLADLAQAAADGKAAVRALIALAEPSARAAHVTPVAPPVRAALAALAEAEVAIAARLELADDDAVAWAADELEVAVIAAGLECTGGELLVRTREIEGHACVELVCGPVAPAGLAARLASALAAVGGGDATVAERRGGGAELVIELRRMA